MDKKEAIELLKGALAEVPHLKGLHHDNQEFELWLDKVMDVIKAGLDADDESRFLRLRGPILSVFPDTPDAVLQGHYLENLGNHETALKSIIQKHEITEMNTSKRTLLADLELFHEKFVRYKQLAIMNEENRVAKNLEGELATLRLELERRYGSLKPVIEKHGSSTRVLLQGGKWEGEAFTAAFSYKLFDPRALEVVMDTAIAAINTTIGKLQTSSTSEVPGEAVYPSGTPYNAYRDIKGILGLATRKLIVIDPYMDGSVVTLLENVQSGVEIQVLTRKMQGDFQLAAQKFKEQREKAGQGSLEIREDTSDFHDRFIVADGRFFHLGASIKDAGEKVCAINEIEDSRNKSLLMEIISKSWDTAEKVL